MGNRSVKLASSGVADPESSSRQVYSLAAGFRIESGIGLGLKLGLGLGLGSGNTPCHDHKSYAKTHFGLTQCLREMGGGSGVCGQARATN